MRSKRTKKHKTWLKTFTKKAVTAILVISRLRLLSRPKAGKQNSTKE